MFIAFIKGISIAAWVGLITLAMLAALIIGGWKAHWWFAQHNADNQAHVIQHGYANQSSLQTEITADISKIDDLNLEYTNGGNYADIANTEHHLLNVICGDANMLDAPMPNDEGTFITAHCVDGHAK